LSIQPRQPPQSPCHVVALTGGIACGKSTVSQYFEALNVPVLDADVFARELVQSGQAALTEIVDYFGESILQQHGENKGRLDRSRLRQLIFNDDSARQRLEVILHPRIYARMQQAVSDLLTPYCLFSIPLLIEKKQVYLHPHAAVNIERIVVVDCTLQQQKQRLRHRDGLTEQDVDTILSIQVDRQTRLGYADDIIDNQAETNHCRVQVKRLHELYLRDFS